MEMIALGNSEQYGIGRQNINPIALFNKKDGKNYTPSVVHQKSSFAK
jgi:hypothetical protein